MFHTRSVQHAICFSTHTFHACMGMHVALQLVKYNGMDAIPRAQNGGGGSGDGRAAGPVDTASAAATATAPAFLRTHVVLDRLGVHRSTLLRWEQAGKVRVFVTPGGQRYYATVDIDRIAAATTTTGDAATGQERAALQRQLDHPRRCVIYARVSSQHQATSGDLARQVADLRAAFPHHELVTDVASGINFSTRAGFTAMVDAVLRGDVTEVVVAHRDRLCRVAFDLVAHVFHAMGTRIVVHALGGDDDTIGDAVSSDGSRTRELADDLLAIVNVFVARANGQRSAANRRDEGEHEDRINNRQEGACGAGAAAAGLSHADASHQAQGVDGRGAVDIQRGAGVHP